MGSPPGWEPGQGRPGAALGIFLLTLAVTAVLGGCAVLASTDFCHGLDIGCSADDSPNRTGGVALAVLAGICLIGGLVWAFRVGVGESREEPVGATPPRSWPGSLWVVTRPGVDLTSVRGEVVAHLGSGTVVTEVRRFFGSVLARTDDGAEGWVAADLMEPMIPPTGAGEGGGDG